MADRTILTESLCHVIWIGDRFKICLMTVVTTGRSPGETRTVARRTDQRGMLTGERKSGGSVIKRGWLPRRCRMASQAVLIERGQLVIRLGRLIIVCLVTGKAGGWCSGVLCCMTGNTGGLKVRAGQGEVSCTMIVAGWSPAVDSMTERTLVIETIGFMIRVDG